MIAIFITACGMKTKVVGKDIKNESVSDFYYTEENINFDAYYLRYRFYLEDNTPMFFFERRERPGDYGPTTEEDAVEKGTLELSEEEWKSFLNTIEGGAVRKREEDVSSGSTGPWMFLYWANKDGSFTFENAEKQEAFLMLCEELKTPD